MKQVATGIIVGLLMYVVMDMYYCMSIESSNQRHIEDQDVAKAPPAVDMPAGSYDALVEQLYKYGPPLISISRHGMLVKVIFLDMDDRHFQHMDITQKIINDAYCTVMYPCPIAIYGKRPSRNLEGGATVTITRVYMTKEKHKILGVHVSPN